MNSLTPLAQSADEGTKWPPSCLSIEWSVNTSANSMLMSSDITWDGKVSVLSHFYVIFYDGKFGGQLFNFKIIIGSQKLFPLYVYRMD